MKVVRTRWRRVEDDRLADLAEGALMRCVVRDRPLCFVRMNGVLRAMVDVCPHQGRPLSSGWCDDGHVVCAYHRFHFDPATGKARHGVCGAVEVFPVEERPNGVHVGFPYTTIRLLGFDLW